VPPPPTPSTITNGVLSQVLQSDSNVVTKREFGGNRAYNPADFQGVLRRQRSAAVIDCNAWNGVPAENLAVRLDMGVYSDYFRPAAGQDLCALFRTSNGNSYEHSSDSNLDNWIVARGDDGRMLGGGAPAQGRSSPVGPYWGAIAPGMPAGGCGHAAIGDAFACGHAFTLTVAVVGAYAPYAIYDGFYKIKSSTYLEGVGTDSEPNFVRACSDYDGVAAVDMIVRVTMGSYVEYLRPTGTLCAMLTNPGQWYWYYNSQDGSWSPVNGNHSALLGGWTTVAPDDRVWGSFWVS
jgi:hypothetical protein